MSSNMFEKTRRKLTITYTILFSVFLVLFAGISLKIMFTTFIDDEEIAIRKLAQHEGEEYVSANELPVDDFNSDLMYAYMKSPTGEIVIDQLTGAPLASEIFAQMEKWPKNDNETTFLILNTPDNTTAVFLLGRSTLLKNDTTLGTLYMFKNLTTYYNTAIEAVTIVAIMLLLFLLSATFIGYYLSGQSLNMIKTAFSRQKEFTADASHELRTPLSVLSLATEGIKHDTDSTLSDFSIQALTDIQNETKRLKQLTESLLTLARSDFQNTMLPKENIYLHSEITQVLNLLQPLASQKDINVIYQGLTDIAIQINKEGLIQVIHILVTNAIKYSTPNTTILVESAIKNNFLYIKVTDQGIGIAPADLDKIFERFYRVDKARSRRETGFGLGLSIAKSVVTQLHGKIHVSSKLNVGSTFTVQFPLV